MFGQEEFVISDSFFEFWCCSDAIILKSPFCISVDTHTITK